MTITCQEEVFSWFQALPGAKRIELMCGLMSMCIPLEVRFFEAVIQDIAKKEFNTFRDAEIKANSRQELEHICKCDLLVEKTTPEYEEAEMNGNGDGSTSQGGPVETLGQKMMLTKYPSRSKLIISLCLLQSTNHQCSSITYNSIRQQLMVENIMHAVYGIYIPKNYPVNGLFSEILLLLTMAIYHPAFTYEERDLLKAQKEEVEQWINAVANPQFRSVTLQQPANAAIQPPPPNQAPSSTNAIGPVPQQTVQPAYANPGVHHQHNPVHTQQHPQPPPSQQVHYQHYGGPHPAANNTGKAPQHQQPHLAPAMHHQQTFPISFIQSHVPIANLSYTPQPQAASAAQVANQTNAGMPNMSMLRINSTPSISSTSPSPTISPSSAKVAVPQQQQQQVPNQQPIAIKLDHTSNMYTTTGLPPNSQLIAYVGDNTGAPGTIPAGIPYMSLPPSHAVLVDDVQKTNSSVSTNNSLPQSSSCYNCGSVGHRGTECTSGGEDNR